MGGLFLCTVTRRVRQLKYIVVATFQSKHYTIRTSQSCNLVTHDVRVEKYHQNTKHKFIDEIENDDWLPTLTCPTSEKPDLHQHNNSPIESDEMPLVQYSDSESDSESRSSLPPAKKPRHNINPGPSLPPLPASFHNLYASSTRVSVQDDPSLHGGRTRVIPHVEGNWPTHLYLECECWASVSCDSYKGLTLTGYPGKDELSLLTDVISQCGNVPDEKAPTVHSLLHSDLGAQLPLHISLSRPVILRTEQRVLFTEALQKAIHDSHVLSYVANLKIC